MKILIVVDMQNDFVDGALGSEEATAIVPNVIEKIKECASDNRYAIIYTRDTHFKNYMETFEGQHLPVPHCIHMTPGWMINKEVWDASEGATAREVVDKFTFGLHDFPDFIANIDTDPFNEWEVESIEIIGVCTDICVVSNAMILKAAYDDIPITVYGNCCAGTSIDAHEAALKVMQMCQIDVI